jgi:hypothetical protein
MELPIRQPPFKYRFAGVGTWYEWGKANDFCFYKKDGFAPSRGDIVGAAVSGIFPVWYKGAIEEINRYVPKSHCLEISNSIDKVKED